MKHDSTGRKITGSYRVVNGEEKSKIDWQTCPTVPAMRKVRTPAAPFAPQKSSKEE